MTGPAYHGRTHIPGGTDPIPNLGADGPWVYVGTPGVDGVDALIATNPSPYDEDPWVPFENSWTNLLGDDAPVSFLLAAGGWVRIRGAIYGGADDTVVFTLPAGWRPEYQQAIICPSGDPLLVASLIVGTDGTVLYETSS